MIVCLHGFAQGPESWLEVVPDEVEVVAPRLPGHAGEPGVASFERAVKQLGAFVEKGCCVAGYSLGARLALALCLRHPERIAGALLVSANPGIEDARERAARREWDDEQAAFLEREGVGRFVQSWEALPMFATQSAHMREAQRATRSRHDAAQLAGAMRSLGQGRMPPLWNQLAQCAVPLRLLVGGEDAKYRAIAERMITLAPSASMRVIDGCGHNLLIEAPDGITRELTYLSSGVDETDG